MAITKVKQSTRTLADNEVAIRNISGSSAASAGTFLKQDGTWASIPTSDTSGIEDDIALLGFKVATAGSMAKYNLVNQTEDAFVDQTGIDTIDSTNQSWNAAKYFSGVTPGNYFGDDSDGAVTISTDTNEIVLNKSGSYDGDMLVKNYSSLTIDASNTLTIDQPARGMLVYVSGNCTINGTLSMTARGAFANPTVAGGSDSSAVSATGLRLPLLKSGSTDVLAAADFAGTGNAAVAAVANQPGIDGNGKIYTVGLVGGAGGASSTISGADAPSHPGSSGAATLSTGGGGAGGGYSEGPSLYIGGGAAGSVFSGGPGGGGAYASSGSQTLAGDGVAYGGAGGSGGGYTVYGVKAGGAGNPGGVSSGGAAMNGNDGTGGLLILIVGGDLTIGGSGSIVAGGSVGGNSVSGGHGGLGGGGGSGGGKILALYAGTLSNSGSIAAAGGGGGYGGSAGRYGKDGGDGHVVTEVIDVAGSPGADMTLVSEFTEAESAPTKGDFVMTYTTAGGGSTTVGTDLTAEVSADDGGTWTDLGLVAGDIQGTTGGHTIISKHDVTITSTITAPYKMRYRVKTLNQSVSKQTRIQAVSLGWS